MTNQNSKSYYEIQNSNPPAGGRNSKLNFLSMSQAAEICPYEQGYLSLLARRGEMKAEKIGRNWYTTVEWINEYLSQKRPGDIIQDGFSGRQKADNLGENENKKIQTKPEKISIKTVAKNNLWIVVSIAIALFVFGTFSYMMKKIDEIEKKTNGGQFIQDEIMKVPNEEGNFDIYGVGRVKIGEESAGTKNEEFTTNLH